MRKHHNVLASPHPNPGLMLLGLNYGRSEYSIHEELTRMGLQNHGSCEANCKQDTLMTVYP
jgi:hypothetical protein